MPLFRLIAILLATEAAQRWRTSRSEFPVRTSWSTTGRYRIGGLPRPHDKGQQPTPRNGAPRAMVKAYRTGGSVGAILSMRATTVPAPRIPGACGWPALCWGSRPTFERALQHTLRKKKAAEVFTSLAECFAQTVNDLSGVRSAMSARLTPACRASVALPCRETAVVTVGRRRRSLKRRDLRRYPVRRRGAPVTSARRLDFFSGRIVAMVGVGLRESSAGRSIDDCTLGLILARWQL